MSERRITAVDAARGVAMVLVCLSHIKHHFVVSAPELHWILVTVTRIATPTFLLLSGFVISHLLRNDTRRSVPVMLIDRGLFLLIVAHAALNFDDLKNVFDSVEITDAVGIALFVSILMRNASATTLGLLGGFICVASWFIAIGMPPAESAAGRTLGSALFNILEPGVPFAHVPIVPYIGAFLIGMALNVALMPKRQSITEWEIAWRFAKIGACAIGTVLLGIAAWSFFGKELVTAAVNDPAVVESWRATLNPASKYPPSPAYFLFYGGAGLLMLAVFFIGRPRWLIGRLKGHACTIGRASLMCFVAQDWLLFLLPKYFGFDAVTSIPFWFGYFFAVVLTLYALSRIWSAYNGNRFLTVGLRYVVKRWGPASPQADPRRTPRIAR